MKILVIDGQGGKIGRQLIEGILQGSFDAKITAVGTNSIATSNMIKGGAKNAATGENAVVAGCRTADVIIGPVGIVIADSLLGEITPQMAVAVGQSSAVRLLIPVNKCDNIVVGCPEQSVSDLIAKTLTQLKALEQSKC